MLEKSFPCQMISEWGMDIAGKIVATGRKGGCICLRNTE